MQIIFTYLTFIGPCIVICFYKNQLDAPMSQIYLFWNHTLQVSNGFSVHRQEFKTVHTTTNLFILKSHSTCFGRAFRPSSGVQNCTYSNKFIYFGITLYMFRTVFPSIVRSSKLYCCLLASKQTAVSV